MSREGGSGDERGWGALQPAKRPRRVLLTFISIDALDEALDVVLAQAAEVMSGGPNARTRILRVV